MAPTRRTKEEAIRLEYPRSHGRVAIGDRFLREAMLKRYLPKEADQQAAHLRLAKYFMAQPVNDRMAQELPFQFREAKDWIGLATALSDPHLSFAALPANILKWVSIGATSVGIALIRLRILQARCGGLQQSRRRRQVNWRAK